jgi:hypothetical protein
MVVGMCARGGNDDGTCHRQRARITEREVRRINIARASGEVVERAMSPIGSMRSVTAVRTPAKPGAFRAPSRAVGMKAVGSGAVSWRPTARGSTRRYVPGHARTSAPCQVSVPPTPNGLQGGLPVASASRA